MQKTIPNFIKFCDAVLKYSLYALIFLLPIAFLPWTADAFDFNKQALLVFLGFIALSAWIVKILISGKLVFRSSKIHFAFFSMLLFFALATAFSINRRGSFWGWPSITSESLLSLLGFAALYFLVSSAFSRREVVNLMVAAGFSGALAILLGTFQLLGIFLPFSFAQTASFNSIGTVGELGLFSAILLPLFIVLVMQGNKWLRVIFSIAVAVSAGCLALVNYAVVWWVVLAGCAILMLFGVIKKDFFDLRWLGLPMFFLVLSLFFIILRVQLPSIQRPVEIFLKQSAGFEVVKQVLKERPIFGSGPGTFSYIFSKYKPSSLNQGLLWNVRFNGAGSKILTVLATTGILGFLGFLNFLGFLGFYGVKLLLQKIRQDGQENYLLFAGCAMAGFTAQIAAYFLYGSNLALDFMFFFLAACFVALFWKEKKEIILRPSSLFTLGMTFLATCIFIFGLGLLFLTGQRYVADINYTSGVYAFAKGEIDTGIEKLERAVSLNSKTDIYLTQLSQAYLFKLNQVIASKDISDENKAQASQILLNNTINSAKMATDVNPRNPSNWIARGMVYQNLIGIIEGSEEWALSSYEQGFQLEPLNPYYPTQKGIVYMAKANILDREDNKKKNQDLESAKQQFDLAIQLKSDYAPARFQIAMFYQAKGQVAQELQALEETKKYSPNDVGLLFQLGLVYYQQKDFKNAKANLEAALLISPNYANALYFLGLSYYKLGQNTKAIEKFEKISELNPDNEQVKKIIQNLRAGKDPLAGIVQESLLQAPVQEPPG